MTTSGSKNQNEISNFENLSSFSSPQMLSFLKISEYLSVAAFVGAYILTRVFPDNQLIIIWTAVFLPSFIFLFLTNRQLAHNSRNRTNQLEIRRKAELYSYSSRSRQRRTLEVRHLQWPERKHSNCSSFLRIRLFNQYQHCSMQVEVGENRGVNTIVYSPQSQSVLEYAHLCGTWHYPSPQPVLL